MVFTALEESTLQILGPLPDEEEVEAPRLHSEVETRWRRWTQQGIPEADRDTLLEKYPRVGGALTLEAPTLNPGLRSAVPHLSVVRDRHHALAQNTLGSAMWAMGQGMTRLLNQPDPDPQLLQLFADAGKLFSSTWHSQTLARRAIVLPNIADPTVRQSLSDTTPSEMLFGENLHARVRELREGQQSEQELANVSSISM